MLNVGIYASPMDPTGHETSICLGVSIPQKVIDMASEEKVMGWEDLLFLNLFLFLLKRLAHPDIFYGKPIYTPSKDSLNSSLSEKNTCFVLSFPWGSTKLRKGNNTRIRG